MIACRRTPLALALLLAAAASAAPARAQDDSTSAVAAIRRDAEALRPLYPSKLARGFLEAASRLPRIANRTVRFDSSRTRFWNEAEAAALPETTRARAITREFDERFYYSTRYGTPLAYARALELLSGAGFGDVRGKRVADFGYGTVGHLRLLADMGADVHGIEVDPLLRALYSWPSDQGAIGERGGRVTLHHGQFPADPALTAEVGGGYHLFLSKNTLKNGYLHPAEPVNPRMLVHLGVSDSAFVAALARILEPGGLAMIYNLCPAPAPPGKPYIPWADGRSPFPRDMFERAGFEVLVFDRDDSPAARTMAHALGWDQGSGAMDLEKDLFGTWTLVRRRR